MSFNVNGQRMMHAAVNTDPLHLIETEESKNHHYGLKSRNIPHDKIKEFKEISHLYHIGEKLGRGAFGVVLAVTQKSNSKTWAMKTITKTTSTERMRLAQQEIEVLKLVRHPHIIYLDRIFESPRTIYIIFEKCREDFSNIYKERRPFTEDVSRKIITDLVDAVAYLHKYDIVHRDLKMENILLGENPKDPKDEYYIKLTDFGLSILKFGKGMYALTDYCGTPQYMAPEIITLRSYTQMCDMWAVGIILYMLVMGDYPFTASTEEDLHNAICSENPDFNDVQLSNELHNLILALLLKNPVKRIRATEVLEHPWIKKKSLSAAVEHNIFEKMKEWKKLEMPVITNYSENTDTPADWALMPQRSSELGGAKVGNSSKQQMVLPKKNIGFDRQETGTAGRHRTSKLKSIAKAVECSKNKSVQSSRKDKGP